MSYGGGREVKAGYTAEIEALHRKFDVEQQAIAERLRAALPKLEAAESAANDAVAAARAAYEATLREDQQARRAIEEARSAAGREEARLRHALTVELETRHRALELGLVEAWNSYERTAIHDAETGHRMA
jgi:hypothetical protein